MLSRAQPLRDRDVLTLLEECCERMGVRRVPLIAESEAVQTPALHGVFRPRLLLPAGFTQTFTTDELRFVFLHELAHLRRHDLLLNWIMTSLQILHWFNPLVWFGFARWRVDREIACDAAALEAAGPSSNRAYGQTLPRLLQHLSPASRRPGLVGILEDRNQLRRRMKMIARFTPARRPFVAAGLLAILAMVGLTDAQVTPPPAPPVVGTAPLTATPISNPATVALLPAVPAGPPVLFLISRSETMLGDTEEEIAQWRTPHPATKESPHQNPQRATQATESLLRALTPERNISWYSAGRQSADPGHSGIRDAAENDVDLTDVIAQRLRTTPPAGGFNLELAFASFSILEPRFHSRAGRLDHRRAFHRGNHAGDESGIFEAAAKTLKPRIPIDTVLLPLVFGEAATAGLYWELANATRRKSHDGFEYNRRPAYTPRLHHRYLGFHARPQHWRPLAHRDRKGRGDAGRASESRRLQLLDGDGRFILPRRGTGSAR